MNGEQSPEMQCRPIAPQEIVEARIEQLPNDVIQVFNELITENLYSGYGRVVQKEVVKRLEDRGLNRQEIYARGWLNIEDVYRQAGWQVEYDKPGYNESYDAYFVFRAPKAKL